MVGIKQFLAFVVLVAGSAGQVWANMAPPPLEPDAAEMAKSADITLLVVFVDHRQPLTQLQIPKRLLAAPSEFRQQPAVAPNQQGSSSLRSRTVVAGLTLSLVLAGGGVVTILVRRHRGRAAIVTSVAVLLALGVCVNRAIANAAPPPAGGTSVELPEPHDYDSLLSRIPPSFSGNLVIQPVEQGDRVTLIIGRDLASAFSNITPYPKPPAGNEGPGSAPPQ